ncbi:tRNA (N6-isopentenyl adenosine(37)-C2)-methylthiotransferase MiaB, partial [bacterium]|nr:tRNA (N6-isopentenyl adenosine(37)-C2)-methylthiotransferase MiaB [bacterium]
MQDQEKFWPQSYYVQTYGCQMNVYDSEIIGALLEERGCAQAPDEASADIVVFNTCCIRDNADQKVYGRLGDFKNLR